MAKYGIIRGRRLVDPNFAIQPGEDATYDELDVDEQTDADDENSDLGLESGDLEVPNIVNITTKTRQDNSGRTVVDLIIEVEDIEGIVKYDTRVTV